MIRGPTKNNHPTVAVFKKRLYGILAQEGVHGYSVSVVTQKSFLGILFRRAANVPAFGIKDDRYGRIIFFYVGNGLFEYVFGGQGREVSDLRFIRTDQIVGGVNDRAVEFEIKSFRRVLRDCAARKLLISNLMEGKTTSGTC